MYYPKVKYLSHKKSLDIPTGETIIARLERQSAENLILKSFGLNAVGFAPYSPRHPKSLYPLVLQAVVDKMEKESPGLSNVESLLKPNLEALLVDQSDIRTRVIPHLYKAAYQLLVTDNPNTMALAFQEYFAIFYTNMQRTAANDNYLAWMYQKCQIRYTMGNSFSTLLLGDFISSNKFTPVDDVYRIGEMGAKRLGPFVLDVTTAIKEGRPPSTTQLFAEVVGKVSGGITGAAFGTAITILSVLGAKEGLIQAGFAATQAALAAGMEYAQAKDVAIGAAKSIKAAVSGAADGIAAGLGASESAGGATVAGSATTTVNVILWVITCALILGLHVADIVSTQTFENNLIHARNDISSQDPAFLIPLLKGDTQVLGTALYLLAVLLITPNPAISMFSHGSDSLPVGPKSLLYDIPELIGYPRCSSTIMASFATPEEANKQCEILIEPELRYTKHGETRIFTKYSYTLYGVDGNCKSEEMKCPFAAPPNHLDTYCSAAAIDWLKDPIGARDIAVTSDGGVWIIGQENMVDYANYRIYRKLTDGRWIQLWGAAAHISAAKGGNAVVVNGNGHVHRWKGDINWRNLGGEIVAGLKRL